MNMKHEDGQPLKAFPHGELIDMRMHPEQDGAVLVSIPYDENMIGDPETGVLHGGIVTTLLDTGCGIASISKTKGGKVTATLDLRIDYMRPARPGAAIFATCECYRVTRSVAFCRGVAYETDPEDPVASAAGAFMLTDLPKGKKTS